METARRAWSGFGDNLLDYNRQRSTYSLWLSLLDF